MKKEKIELEVNKIIEAAKSTGSVTDEEINEKFKQLSVEEMEEVLASIKAAGIELIETSAADNNEELEKLINIDCKSEPQRFYTQLQKTRRKRDDIDASIKRLDETLGKHRQSLLDLKERLAK